MIAVVDYGMGNLRSVGKALELIGAEICVTGKREEIKKARGIVLPGVGAFIQAMKNLEQLNLISIIFDSVKKNKPLLGICLGMQLLFTESEEGGRCKGFGIVKGKVKRFGRGLKVPHMGWNNIKIKPIHSLQVNGCAKSNIKNKKSKILKGIPDSSYMYFVHSYYGEPENERLVLATAEYGVEFAAAISKDNIFGVQFHPEKSHSLGLRILENFCKLC